MDGSIPSKRPPSLVHQDGSLSKKAVLVAVRLISRSYPNLKIMYSGSVQTNDGKWLLHHDHILSLTDIINAIANKEQNSLVLYLDHDYSQHWIDEAY